MRTWQAAGGDPPFDPTKDMDALGWPLRDVEGVIFDDRPSFAWAPPLDDPQARQVTAVMER